MARDPAAALTVSQLARLCGVSVRTLHHYDELGLLRPSARSDAGYRLYGDQDLQKLQQILFFRELDFPLEEIQRLVNDPGFDVDAALLMQRQLLTEKVQRIRALIDAVDAAIAARERGLVMTKEEMFEVFGDFDPKQYEAEAEQRWGDSEAFKESTKRAKRYGKKEWEAIKDEGAKINDRFLALMKAGKRADSPEAMAVAEAHREYISRWFYPCSPELHRGLGQLYVTDERFTQNIDRTAPGLAQFMADAIAVNSELHRKS